MVLLVNILGVQSLPEWWVGRLINASMMCQYIRLNRNGLLTGKAHFNGINLMKQLLENEGIVVEENKIINLENIFWDPSKELL